MDETLNRAIDAALDEVRAVRPAPDFLPRLRAHVEQMPARTPIRWWIPVAASATAVAAGVIVAALVRAPRVDPFAGVAPIETAAAIPRPAPSVSPPRLAAPVAETRKMRPAVGASNARRIRGTSPPQHSEAVLVPPGQLAAIGRLLEAINAGDEHAASAVRKLGTGTAIEIAPIQIAPLVVPSLKESS